MTLFSIYLAAALFAFHTGANRFAGPYEIMFLWHSYRIEVDQYGVGETLLAPGCRGSFPDKSCDFDDFCKHVELIGAKRAKKDDKWTGNTSAKGQNFPDIEKTTQELRAINPYNMIQNAHILMPTVFTDPKKTEGGLSQILSETRNRIGEIMADEAKKVSDKDKPEGNEEDLLEHYEGKHHQHMKAAREALDGTSLARRSDQAGHAVKYITASLQANYGEKAKLFTTKHMVASYGEWDEMDTSATIRGLGPTVDVKMEQFIAGYLAEYDESQRYLDHVKALAAIQETRDTFHGGPAC